MKRNKFLVISMAAGFLFFFGGGLIIF